MNAPYVGPPTPFDNRAGHTPADYDPPTGRRRFGWRRRRPTTAAAGVGMGDSFGDVPVFNGVLALPEPLGPTVRTSTRKARRGWYAPLATPALTTTRQAEILNTTLVAAATDPYGIIIGRDRLSQTPVAHDPFSAYERKIITSPHVVVLGAIGSGKSSLLKTVYVLRPLIMRNSRVVVIDKKDRGGEGEYCQLTRELGGEPLRFVLGGGGTRLNILDPVILAAGENVEEGKAAQLGLLIALAELANASQPLDSWQLEALSAAYEATLAVADTARRVPVIEDLLPQLGQLHPAFDDYSPLAKERIHQSGLSVRQLFRLMLSSRLAGLFDGPTSANVRLADRLTTFDVSQLPESGPALPMVMSVANTWLLGVLRNYRGLRTRFIVEEGWHIVDGPAAAVYRNNSKLARGLGLSMLTALHHGSDTPPDSPAVAALKEAETVHLYRQNTLEDIEACVSMFNLDASARSILANLQPGQHLLRIGNRREIHVEHVRSAFETAVGDTDEAMTLRAVQRAVRR